MDALWLTVLRRHAKDEKVRRSRSVVLVCRRSEGTCEPLWGISLGLQTLAKSFSWSNPMLITEAWLWITQPLKLSEKSFTTSLSEWSVTNPWRKHFSVVKRSSSRKGSISLSVRNFIREAWHSWAMERKMFWFLAITWHVFWVLFLFCFFKQTKRLHLFFTVVKALALAAHSMSRALGYILMALFCLFSDIFQRSMLTVSERHNHWTVTSVQQSLLAGDSQKSQ